MKLTNKILIVATFLLIAVTISLLASCGTPAADPKDAETALTEHGYTIRNSDAISGYWTSKGVKKISKIVVAEKEYADDDDEICIMYFEDAEAAEDAFPVIKKWIADEVDDIDEILEISDNMIYFGDKTAADDAH